MPTVLSLGKRTVVFFCLGSCLFSAQALPLPVRLLSDSAYARLVPGKPAPLSPSPPAVPFLPRVLYREEVVLQNGGQATKLRFYSDEDPANPPLWFHVWEKERRVQAVREEAPEELARLGEKSGHPVRHAWAIPMVFAAGEIKRIRIQAEYPVLPVPGRRKTDRFEIYFSRWGWQPSDPELLFRFDLGPMISAIPSLGRPPTPALHPWLLSSWFTVEPAGYRSSGYTVWWRFRETGETERCERIRVEWYAWYR